MPAYQEGVEVGGGGYPTILQEMGVGGRGFDPREDNQQHLARNHEHDRDIPDLHGGDTRTELNFNCC